MIYSRRYSRNFVPLKQDSTKHNLDFRPSLGRCVIEIKDGKGKINIYAQGISPKEDYNLELVGFEKGNIKNVSLGKFNVDTYGKGEFSVAFDPDNMNNNKIEDFNVISIMVKDNNNISSALVGYIGNEIDWQDSYKANAIINIPKEDCSCIEKPEEDNTNGNDNNGNNQEDNNENMSDFEKGLLEKEQGLIDREQGLIDREKGIEQREENEIKVPLDEFEKRLKERLDGLAEKEKGLAEKEQGLLEKERELKKGNLPTDDKELREKEMELIKRELGLIKVEQELINRERELVRKNPTSEREKGLIEKEKGILEREQGLIEREKGLIEKEKGLLEIEKGIREKNKYTKKEINNSEVNSNHQNFKDMLDNLKKNMLDIQNMDNKKENINNIDYIKSKNVIMSPFINKHQNITWYRISPCDLINISSNSWKYSNNPFVFTSYKKYKHLMLGIDNSSEEEIYILAIPCRYENDFNLKDFKQFLPIDNNISTNSIDIGEYGYRIVNL